MSQYRLPVADFVARAQAAEAGGFDGVAFFDHLETPGRAGFPGVGGDDPGDVGGCQDRTHHDRSPGPVRRISSPRRAGEAGRHAVGGLGWTVRARHRFGLDAEGTGEVRPLRRRCAHPQRTTRPRSVPAQGVLGPRRSRPDGPSTLPDASRFRSSSGYRAPDVGRGPAARRLVESSGAPGRQLPKLLPAIGSARASVQQMVGFVRDGDDHGKVAEASTRRWGSLGPGLVCGDADRAGGALQCAVRARARNGSTCGSRTTHRRMPSRNSVRR